MKKKQIFLVLSLMFITALLAVGVFFGRDKVLLNKLQSEINELAKLDVSSSRYNRKIKTGGNYAIVESTIKDYLDDYAVLLQETLEIKQDKKLTKILSYSNYEQDGPNFEESLKYLTESRQTFNSNIDKLLKKSQEEEIIKYGEEKISDEYYLSIYEELILSENMKNGFWSTSDTLLTTRDDINKIFDKSSEALNLLVTNQNYWKLEDGEIKIMSQQLYDKYMAIINEIKK